MPALRISLGHLVSFVTGFLLGWVIGGCLVALYRLDRHLLLINATPPPTPAPPESVLDQDDLSTEWPARKVVVGRDGAEKQSRAPSPLGHIVGRRVRVR